MMSKRIDNFYSYNIYLSREETVIVYESCRGSNASDSWPILLNIIGYSLPAKVLSQLLALVKRFSIINRNEGQFRERNFYVNICYLYYIFFLLIIILIIWSINTILVSINFSKFFPSFFDWLLIYWKNIMLSKWFHIAFKLEYQGIVNRCI